MAETGATQPKISRKERRMQWWSEHQKQITGPDEEKPQEPKAVNLPTKDESADALPSSQLKDKKASKKDSSKKFYVLFVNQIPYSATTEDITKHFSKAGKVKSVRLLTHKDTGKSRGFGYVEFSDNRSYMTGLSMHLSKLHGRPINVEITSPGRGTSLFRKENLKRKNKEMARFRGLKEDGTTGGALCIPSTKSRASGGGGKNKKKKFESGGDT